MSDEIIRGQRDWYEERDWTNYRTPEEDERSDRDDARVTAALGRVLEALADAYLAEWTGAGLAAFNDAHRKVYETLSRKVYETLSRELPTYDDLQFAVLTLLSERATAKVERAHTVPDLIPGEWLA